MSELASLIHLELPTVTGQTVRENIKNAQVLDHNVIHPISDPVHKEGGIAILSGNLAPKGAVIKTAGVSPLMLKHSGPAQVFDSETEAVTAIRNRQIKEGDVVVSDTKATRRSRHARNAHPNCHHSRHGLKRIRRANY
jgi:dihydroxy-acid dehydratase